MRKILLSLAALALFALPVIAAEKTAAAPPEMSAEDKAMMEACTKAGTPGPAHAALEPTVGMFDVNMSSWMKPGTPAMTSTGTATRKWIFGGRYVEESFSGSMMDMPFEGRGLTAYDNVQGKYVSTWIDSMSTGIMTSVGKATGKDSFDFTGKYWDPMTSKETTSRMELKVKNADEYMLYMYGPGADGKDFKMMELTYKRKPGTSAANAGQ